MSEPDYVVIRPAPDLPPGFNFPDRWNGMWLDRSQIPEDWTPGRTPPGVTTSTMKCVPTGRFEVRDYDGAVAEVWEAHPGDAPTA